MPIEEIYSMNISIPNTVETLSIHGPFSTGVEIISDQKYRVLSIQDLSEKGLDIKTKYFVREGFIYLPNEGTRIVRDSPLLFCSKDAIAELDEEKEIYLLSSDVNNAKRNSICIPNQGIKALTRRLDENEVLTWLIGGEKQARAYGEHLAEKGIKWISIESFATSYINKSKSPFVRQATISNKAGELLISGIDPLTGNVTLIAGKEE